MNILPLAILILSASGSATAEREYDQEIAGIIVRVIWGAVSDELNTLPGVQGDHFWRRLKSSHMPVVSLRIDETERTGWRSWGEAVVRVARYAANGASGVDGRGHTGTGEVERIPGSVGLAYRVRVRRFDIATTTLILDGRVEKVVDAWWTERVPVGRSTREVPIHVTIRITAVERAGKTLLAGTATGWANLSSFRCGLVRRFAEREATATLDRELAAALIAIEHKGTDWYHSAAGYIAILDRIGDGMRTVGTIGRRR